MPNINFTMHPGQMEVYQSDARFKVVVAGRRWGKSELACIKLLIEALKAENEFGYNLLDKDVFYVAPTFQQAKDAVWRKLKNLGVDVIEQALENTAQLRLKNGRVIHLKGSDKPDTLRGVGLSFVVLDEFATMKPETWEEIIQPTLTDVKGSAMFIGTPAGKNHFYDLFMDAKEEEGWEAFEYRSVDNPYLDSEEVEKKRRTMSHESFRQEYEANFSTGGGNLFLEDQIIVGPEPVDGEWYLSMDPAGYVDVMGATKSKLKRFDETAIACVKAGTHGWHVGDIITGRWGVREASLRLLNAVRTYRPMAVGIEGGSLRNAILPYLQDQMKRLNIYPNLIETRHGGQKKVERITWALQGRMQHGRITFGEGAYLNKLRDQFLDFPNPMSHDDMLDALAYIDQVARVSYFDDRALGDTWEPVDMVAGY